LAQKIKYKMDF